MGYRSSWVVGVQKQPELSNSWHVVKPEMHHRPSANPTQELLLHGGHPFPPTQQRNLSLLPCCPSNTDGPPPTGQLLPQYTDPATHPRRLPHVFRWFSAVARNCPPPVALALYPVSRDFDPPFHRLCPPGESMRASGKKRPRWIDWKHWKVALLTVRMTPSEKRI